MTWHLVFTRLAQKDAQTIAAAGLREKVEALLDILRVDPMQFPPRFEKLIGDLDGAFSRRISLQHRLVYQLYPGEHVVKVLRMWTHYE